MYVCMYVVDVSMLVYVAVNVKLSSYVRSCVCFGGVCMSDVYIMKKVCKRTPPNKRII